MLRPVRRMIQRKQMSADILYWLIALPSVIDCCLYIINALNKIMLQPYPSLNLRAFALYNHE